MPGFEQDLKNRYGIGQNERPEFFHYLGLSFDIAKAKKILDKYPHEQVMVPVESLRQYLAETNYENGKAIGIKLGVSCNKEYAETLTVEDLKRPLILVPLKEEIGHLVIDGYHRIAAAVRLGVQELPAVILTPKEARGVTIRGEEFLYHD